MIVDDLVRNPGGWLSGADEVGIVISSRVRLARNVRGTAFPGWADEQARIALCERLRSDFEALDSVVTPVFFDMGQLAVVDKQVLEERHLISHELAGRMRGSGLVVDGDERVALMINEEDHLRLQVISPGMAIRQVWEKANAVDSEIEARVDYAFSRKLGYLTACPSNVGTGLRASVMLHLSGLRLTGDLEGVVKGLQHMGLAVRGLLGEGTEAFGNLFQISNQNTLGQTEVATIAHLEEVVSQVVQHERNARARLMEKRPALVHDRVGRAIGILMHAQVLSSHEAIELLSALRFGVEMDLVGELGIGRLNQIMLLTQPGHLQTISGKALSPDERDELRARIVRERLEGVRLVG